MYAAVLLLCGVRAACALDDAGSLGVDLIEIPAEQRGCTNYRDEESCANATTLCVFDEGSQVCAQPCELLSKNDSFGKLVQVALGVLALFVLLVKRNYEAPKRPIVIWACDISKQCASMACAHVGGMLNAIILSGLTWGGDECSWYLISFTVDTTVGVTLAIHAMRLVAYLARWRGWTALATSGDYGPGSYVVQGKKVPRDEYEKLDARGDPFVFDQPRAAAAIWFQQLSVWCIITVCARACCGGLMFLASPVLQLLSEKISDVFIGHPKRFLVLVCCIFRCVADRTPCLSHHSDRAQRNITWPFHGTTAQVMLGCPVGMNLIQVWIQDNILSKIGSRFRAIFCALPFCAFAAANRGESCARCLGRWQKARVGRSKTGWQCPQGSLHRLQCRRKQVWSIDQL